MLAGLYVEHSYVSLSLNYFLKAIIITNKGNPVELACVHHIQNASKITGKLFVD